MVSKKNKEELRRLIREYELATQRHAVVVERTELNLDTFAEETRITAERNVAWAALEFFIKHNI